MTRNIQCIQTWKFWAMVVSTTSISLLNRFKILPSGVDSKNDIGHAIIFLRRPAWRTRPAPTFPTYKDKVPPVTKTAEIQKVIQHICKKTLSGHQLMMNTQICVHQYVSSLYSFYRNKGINNDNHLKLFQSNHTLNYSFTKLIIKLPAKCHIRKSEKRDTRTYNKMPTRQYKS